MANQLNTDDLNELFELVHFDNGLSEYHYSITLHRVNAIAENYNLNLEKMEDFHFALTLIH